MRCEEYLKDQALPQHIDYESLDEWSFINEVFSATIIDSYNLIYNWTNMRVQRTRTKQLCARASKKYAVQFQLVFVQS